MSVNKFKVGDVVKCVDVGVCNNLTIGKDYMLLDVSDDGEMLEVENDKGSCFYYCSYRFELSGDKSLQPPKFKEGDMVYLIGFDCLKPHKLISTGDDYLTMKFKVEVVNDVFETFTADGKFLNKDATPRIVLATEENRLMLNKLLGVEYEPVKLTGSDLAKKLLKGKPQTCYMSDISDDVALSNKCIGLIAKFENGSFITMSDDVALSDECIDLIAKFENGSFITMSGVRCKFAVPCDSHGNVLEDE